MACRQSSSRPNSASPGRSLKAGERPLLLFIAEQIDALPEAIGDHLATEWNRRPANRPRESRGRADRLLYSDYHVEVEGPFPSGVLTGRVSGRSPATDAAGRTLGVTALAV